MLYIPHSSDKTGGGTAGGGPPADFTYFVNYAVEIRTRIRIAQGTGSVDRGALFSVEFVPSEAIFYSFVFFIERKEGDSSDARTKFEKLFSSEDKDKANKNKVENKKVKELVLQFGGDETMWDVKSVVLHKNFLMSAFYLNYVGCKVSKG